jgi:hypothetical protein
VNQAVHHQLSFDGINGARNPVVVDRQESDQRQQQQARIERLGAIVFDEGAKTAVVTLATDFVMHLLSQLLHSAELRAAVRSAVLDAADITIDRDPGRDLRIDVVPRIAP